MSKKITIIKKEDNNIFLESSNNHNSFFKKYGRLTIFISIMVLITSLVFTLTNMEKIEEYTLNSVNFNVVFPDGDDGKVVIGDDDTINNNKENNNEKNNIIKTTPEELFKEYFGVPDEVIFKIKTIVLSNMTIMYYSDSSAKLIYKTGVITRILPVNNKYAVDENGTINKEAERKVLKIDKEANTPQGKVIYYVDGSAEILNEGVNLWVGDKTKITDNYITTNKISYSNAVEKHANFNVTKYNDGTIVIEDQNNKYVVRNSSDVAITESSFTFNNNNQSTIVATKTKMLDNGFKVEYLSDGGAIISSETGNISVRKSNSIIIEDNKLVKVKLSNEVEVASISTIATEKVVYYTNGCAVVKKDEKIIGYVEENEKIKFTPSEVVINQNDLIGVNNTKTPNNNMNITVFDNGLALVENGTTYIDKDEVIVIDASLNVRFLDNATNINVTKVQLINTGNKNMKYKIVLDKSDSSTLTNINSIKYGTSLVNQGNAINTNIWSLDHKDYYVLYSGVVNSGVTENKMLAIWLDHKNLTNVDQDKYFYGTIRVFSCDADVCND